MFFYFPVLASFKSTEIFIQGTSIFNLWVTYEIPSGHRNPWHLWSNVMQKYLIFSHLQLEYRSFFNPFSLDNNWEVSKKILSYEFFSILEILSNVEISPFHQMKSTNCIAQPECTQTDPLGNRIVQFIRKLGFKPLHVWFYTLHEISNYIVDGWLFIDVQGWMYCNLNLIKYIGMLVQKYSILQGKFYSCTDKAKTTRDDCK